MHHTLTHLSTPPQWEDVSGGSPNTTVLLGMPLSSQPLPSSYSGEGAPWNSGQNHHLASMLKAYRGPTHYPGPRLGTLGLDLLGG